MTKWLMLLLSGGLLIGIGWRRWWRYFEQHDQHVSEAWLEQQERRDLIQGRQWDGLVRWPWNVTSDDQECA